jgi:hypothetical protein
MLLPAPISSCFYQRNSALFLSCAPLPLSLSKNHFWQRGCNLWSEDFQILCVPQEEPIAGHLGVNGVYYKLGKGNTKGSMVGAGGICRQRDSASLLQVLLKHRLICAKGGTRWFPSNNQWVGTGMGGSLARWG